MINRSKLVIPAAPESVPRPRVHELFEAASERQAILVQAPAGYGKTTAARAWLESRRRPAVWLSLADCDNDPHRLAEHLLAALDDGVPGSMASAMQALEGGSDPLRTCLPLAVDALREEAPERFVVVLDDYHVIAEPSCHALVRGFLDALPIQVSCALMSRAKPPLRLARRVAAGSLSTLGVDELAFTIDEAERMFNGEHRLGLSAAEVRRIHACLDGWPVALSLFATARHAADQANTPRDVEALFATVTGGELADYVIDELLDHVEPPERQFMLYASVLERMTGALCVAVMADPEAARLFDAVRVRGEFIASVEDGWGRMRELVRGPLLACLAAREPEIVPVLHDRASVWFERAGMPEEALRHAVAAGNGIRCAQLLAADAVPLLLARRWATLRRALSATPPDRGELGPFCEALDVVLMLGEGVDPRITATRGWALALADPDRVDVQQLLAPVLATPFYGDVPRALEAGWSAWTRFEHQPDLRLGVLPSLALSLWFAGDLEAARTLLEPFVSIGEPAAVAIYANGLMGLMFVDEGDPTMAERYARAAAQLIREIGTDATAEFAMISGAIGDALRAAGKLDEARGYVDAAYELEAARPGSVGHGIALLFDAQLALLERRRERARASAVQAREILSGFPDVGAGIRRRLEGVERALATPTDQAARGSMPTPSEMRILELLALSRSRTQIAQELFVSEATVKSHIRRLYRRLGARNRADALACAVARGFLPPPPRDLVDAGRGGRN